MLPNGTEVAFTGSPGEENNALVSVTEMVRSLPKRTLPANIDHALAHNQVMEVLAFMTEIAQAHCDSMKNNLCSTFRKIVQDTVSPNIGDEDQVAKMKEELDESIKSKLDSCNAKLDSTLKSKFDSCYSKIETMLNSKADRHLVTKLENKLNSKVDGSLLSKLDIKVDEIATDVKTTAQLEGKFNAAIKESDNVSAQALAKIKTSLSDHNLTASDVLTKLEGLKSSFKDLDKISTKQRSENGHLVQQLREKEQARLAQEKAQLAVEKACKIQEKALQAQQQAHEAQISKMTCTANERYTETMAQFTQLENTLLHKVDVSQTQQNVRLAVEKAREIQENALQDQEEAHVAQISKMTAIANERYTELIAKVAKLENTLLHKAELSNCESLKGKVTNVEDNLKSEVKQLQADLKKTKAKIDPKTHHIGPRLDKQQKDLDLLQNEVQTQVANVTAKFVEHQEELVRMRSLLSAKSTQTPIQPAPTPSNGVARPTKGTTKGPTNTPVPSKSSTGSTSQPSNGRPPFLSDIKGTTSQHPSAAEKGAAQMMASRHARPPAPTAPPAPPAPTAPTAPSAPSAPSGLPAKPPKALDSSRWAQDPSFSPPSTTVEQRMRKCIVIPFPFSPMCADPKTEMAMNPNGPASVALEHHTPSQLTNSIHATPKDKKFPPGEGPGPNGGQRVNTPRTKGHNRERGIKNNVKKALLQFTEAQQQHARCCQDPVNLTFARDSPWAWLNPIVKEGKRFHEVRPPYGWSVPN